MRVNDTLAVQQLQSRLFTMMVARQYPQIPQQLFSKGSPAVCLAPDAPVQGLNAVNTYFHTLLARSDTAGGYLRGDLPTTQVIEVSPDGRTAAGTWLTFGSHVSEAPEAERTVADCVGRYRSQCVVEDGVWRIERLDWEPVLTFAPSAYQAHRALAAQHQEQWPQPPVRLHELRTEDPADQSEAAADTLRIENAFGRFLQTGADGGWPRAAAEFFTPDATLRLDAAEIQGTARIAQALAQAFTLCLSTSRVIRPEGHATWAAMSLRVDGTLAYPCWGRWYVDLEKTDRWRCNALRWITIAALEPWTLDKGGETHAG